MNINPVHHLALRPAVVDMHLDSVCHVVCYRALLQVDISSSRVNIEPVPPVPGDVGTNDGDRRGGQGDVNTW